MKELIEAYDEYIGLLEADGAGHAGFLYAHGYRCPADKILRGQELRKKIADLKSALDKSMSK